MLSLYALLIYPVCGFTADDGAAACDKRRMDDVRESIERFSSEIAEPEKFHIALELSESMLDDLELSSNKQRALLSLGGLSKEVDDSAGAAKFYREGLELAPDGPFSQSLRLKIAGILRSQGRFDEAEELLKSATEKIPTVPETVGANITINDVVEVGDYAMTAALNGDIDKAIREFKIAATRFPTHMKILSNMATDVGEALAVRGNERLLTRDQFYTKLITESPDYLNSELLLSNYVVSAHSLRVPELLVQRIELYADKFPESVSLPYFYIWAADVVSDEERKVYLEKAKHFPGVTPEIAKSVDLALDALAYQSTVNKDDALGVKQTTLSKVFLIVNICVVVIIVLVIFIGKRRTWSHSSSEQ